ncbi:MAG: A/G-specific adenine glycosylase [Myxococcales bacterium]|nr:A/G-specific adenine glycosylase [Myxococcales bacterium]MCB9707422.1 A/G-specific adenine glycosylase [Myxococcales bacterium]
MPRSKASKETIAKVGTARREVTNLAARRKMRATLLRWYHQHRRALPWRDTQDPYAIWVSEVMLQQTQVSTVIPYYMRFMQTFPDAAALSEASEDQVLRAWSGLGYYRRARLLHAGVREVVANYDAKVPVDPSLRKKLPGIGAYTAGAIGSIAFGLPEPIVDGNVARVISRVYGVKTPLGETVTKKHLWAYAAALVEGPEPGNLNQALMELGATICRKRPQCSRCPIRRFCYAYATHQTDRLPLPKARKAPMVVKWAAVIPFCADPDDDEVWLIKGGGSLFGGLWGVPMAEGSDTTHACAALDEAGIVATLLPKPMTEFVHVLTHRKFHVRAWFATQARAESSDQCRRVNLNMLSTFGISALTRKLLATGKQLRL